MRRNKKVWDSVEKPVQRFIKAARDLLSSWNWADLQQSLEISQMFAALFYQHRYGIGICICNDSVCIAFLSDNQNYRLDFFMRQADLAAHTLTRESGLYTSSQVLILFQLILQIQTLS
ncbi:hypothetical protein MTR_2g017690 [Medicago truncatula]|uniref:Uncharacterized protein n=1 Tax=Medicago truncatula TaxID=3880 RepID=G7ILL6_MEDTR|nr:hypothetical protein MTR_2g017690 [Medicago truncatula]